MIRFLRALVTGVGVAGFLASGAALAAQGFLQEVNGDVSIATGAATPRKAVKNMHVEDNTTITTGAQSYAVLKFEDGTSVLIKENSSFQVQHYRYDAKNPERGNALFNLARGGLRLLTGLLSSKNRDALKVASPIATIGIRGTEFMMELVNPLYIQVINGVVSVTNAAGTMLVSVSQAAIVANAQTLGTLISQLPAGVLQFPNFPLTPVPVTLPVQPLAALPGATVGAIGAGVAAGLSAISDNDSATTHSTTNH